MIFWKITQKLDSFGETLFFYPVANTFSQTNCQIPHIILTTVLCSTESEPCKFFCKPEVKSDYREIPHLQIDGTPCKADDARRVCFKGKCKVTYR